MPGDLTRWLTWMTSLYADGFMLDLSGETPTALYDVRKDPDGEHNLLETEADVVRSLLDKYQRWKLANAKGDHS